jgi:hypothetical protein
MYHPRACPHVGAKQVVVEVCCGTKSVSKIAKAQGHVVVTVDIDPECIPKNPNARSDHFMVDLLGGSVPGEVGLGGTTMTALKARLASYLASGCVILMHGSPPCDQVSVMNTTGSKSPAFPAKLARSLRIFHAFVELANRFAVAWTLENPATGHLWHPQWLRQHLSSADRGLADVPCLTNMKVVDYCQYGWPMKKTTGLAMSSHAMKDAFVARRCPGVATCDMCIDAHGQRKHAVSMVNLRGYYDCSTKHARYPIPPALVVHMLESLKGEAARVLGGGADDKSDESDDDITDLDLESGNIDDITDLDLERSSNIDDSRFACGSRFAAPVW